MKKLMVKVKKALGSITGSLTTEQMVLIFMVLSLATVLFLFRDKVSEFIQNATKRLGEDDFKLN